MDNSVLEARIAFLERQFARKLDELSNPPNPSSSASPQPNVCRKSNEITMPIRLYTEMQNENERLRSELERAELELKSIKKSVEVSKVIKQEPVEPVEQASPSPPQEVHSEDVAVKEEPLPIHSSPPPRASADPYPLADAVENCVASNVYNHRLFCQPIWLFNPNVNECPQSVVTPSHWRYLPGQLIKKWEKEGRRIPRWLKPAEQLAKEEAIEFQEHFEEIQKEHEKQLKSGWVVLKVNKKRTSSSGFSRPKKSKKSD